MSGYPVAKSLVSNALSRHAVGEPVSIAHGQWWINSLSTLVGYVKPSVFQVRPKPFASSSAQTFVLPYKRTKGCEVLLCETELYSTTAYSFATQTWGAGDWIDGGTFFDNTVNLVCNYDRRDQQTYRGLKDATYYTVDAISPITITTTPVASKSIGITSLRMVEVPRGLLDPYNTAADPGLNPSWPIPPGKLVEGSTSDTNRGSARLYTLLDQARAKLHTHRGIARPRENPWQHTSTSYTDLFTGSLFKTRARRLYTTATEEPVTGFVHYASDVKFYVRMEITTSTGTVNRDLGEFSASGGTSTWTSDSTFTTTLPTDHATSGEEQEISIKFRVKLSSAGTVNLATIFLLGSET